MSRSFSILVSLVVGFVSCGSCGCATTVADSTIKTPGGTTTRHFDETGYGDRTYTETVDVNAQGYSYGGALGGYGGGYGMMGGVGTVMGPAQPFPMMPSAVVRLPNIPSAVRLMELVPGGAPVYEVPRPPPPKAEDAPMTQKQATSLAKVIVKIDERLEKVESSKTSEQSSETTKEVK